MRSSLTKGRPLCLSKPARSEETSTDHDTGTITSAFLSSSQLAGQTDVASACSSTSVTDMAHASGFDFLATSEHGLRRHFMDI